MLHCLKHYDCDYDYDCDRKIRYKFGPLIKCCKVSDKRSFLLSYGSFLQNEEKIEKICDGHRLCEFRHYSLQSQKWFITQAPLHYVTY